MTDAQIAALFSAESGPVYLDAAAQGLMPVHAVERIAALAADYGRRGSAALAAGLDEVAGALAAAGRLLGVDASELTLTSGTTEAIAKVASALDWRAGDEVVIAEIEYPANVYPWAALARRGVRLRVARAADGRVEPERLLGLMTERTRVLAVSHVQFSSGWRIDLAPLGAACAERDVLLFVDAVQSLGAVPCDPRGAAVGALVADGRKWLLGPPACGLLWVAPRWLPRLDALAAGVGSLREIDAPLAYRDHVDAAGVLDAQLLLRADVRRLAGGYPPVLGAAGLRAALETAELIGRPTIERRIAEHVARIVAAAQRRGHAVYGPRSADERAGIVALEPAGADGAEALAARLRRDGFVVGVRDGRLRLAPHVYNTDAQIDALLERLEAE